MSIWFSYPFPPSIWFSYPFPPSSSSALFINLYLFIFLLLLSLWGHHGTLFQPRLTLIQYSTRQLAKDLCAHFKLRRRWALFLRIQALILFMLVFPVPRDSGVLVVGCARSGSLPILPSDWLYYYFLIRWVCWSIEAPILFPTEVEVII